MTEHCKIVVTPEGLVRECVDVEMRSITYDMIEPERTVEERDERIAVDRRAIERDGFTLGWERSLWS